MAESDFLNESVKDKDESDLKASTPPAVASSSSSIKLRKSSNILSAIVRGSLRKKPKVVISDVSVHNLSCVSTSSVPAERPSKRNMRETLWNIVGRGTSMRTNKNVSDDGISSWFFYNVGEEKARLEHNLSTSQNQTVFYEQKCKSLEDDLKAIKRQMEELKSKNEQDKLTIAKLEETKLLRGFGTDHMAEEPQDEKAEIKLLRLRCAMLERENSELGKLKTENQMLERNLETGHHLVTSLQIERSKYLEEKNVFLTVICHLKRELTRTKRLKDDLMTVTEKASKLGMIAEFNKQQGDKLKEEIMHKEGEISRLRASVHKLNQAQIRSAEEKRSLCSELDEACRVKEQLSQVLDNEVRKSAELDRSKGDAVKSANSQVEKIEETQRKERATIRILLRDLKILAEEKEVLVKEKNDMGSELEEAKKKNREQEDIIENLKSALKHGQEGAAEMRKTCETLDALKDQLKTKLDQQILKYDNNVNQLGKLIDQLRQEKKEADNKIKLLVEKSQELQQSLEEEKGKNSRIENCAREHCAEKESLSKEIERLTNEADYLNKLMEKVVDDFKNSVKSSRDKEEMYKSELKESRAIINTYATELDNLYRIVAEQKKEAATLNSLKQDVVSMETELVVLKRAKRQLEEKLSDAEETHNKEIDAMRDHLNAVLKQTTKDCGCYKEHLSGLVRKSEALEFFGSKENVALTQELTQKRDQITFLERELIERESVISDTVKKMADLEARLASQQIQNSEITLQLHETRRKLETEECLCKQLRNTQQLLLAAVLQIKENRKIDPVDCVHLMHLIRGSLAGGTAWLVELLSLMCFVYRNQPLLSLMEFLTKDQLLKYESIINQIQEEHQKTTELRREIDHETNKLVIVRLCEAKPALKMCHVNVKVFTDIVELFHLYNDELNSNISEFVRCENCKFYLVEVLIVNALQRKIRNFDWYLNVTLNSSSGAFSKSISLTNKSFPLLEVLPVDENIVECEIVVTLFLPSNDHILHINLETVLIDISYHSEIFKRKTGMSLPKKMLELTKSHNTGTNIAEIRKPLLLECNWLTDIDDSGFIELFLKNCYHKIGLEIFSDLKNNPENDFVIRFSTGVNKHSITFSRNTNSIIIKSNAVDLLRWKKYFRVRDETFRNLDSTKIVKEIESIASDLMREKSVSDSRRLYLDVRRLWSRLPI